MHPLRATRAATVRKNPLAEPKGPGVACPPTCIDNLPSGPSGPRVSTDPIHRLMQLTQRTRRRVLKAVLPLVVIVWTNLPWLPCCQELPAHPTEHHSRAGDHAAHTDSAARGIAQADVAARFVPHAHHTSTRAAADALISGTEPDGADGDSDADAPACGDVIKNHSDARPATSATADVALAGPALILPVVLSLVESASSIDEPPRNLKRRPLHLAKSALLI